MLRCRIMKTKRWLSLCHWREYFKLILCAMPTHLCVPQVRLITAHIVNVVRKCGRWTKLLNSRKQICFSPSSSLCGISDSRIIPALCYCLEKTSQDDLDQVRVTECRRGDCIGHLTRITKERKNGTCRKEEDGSLSVPIANVNGNNLISETQHRRLRRNVKRCRL